MIVAPMLALLLLAAPALADDTAKMSAGERNEMIELLDSSSELFLGLISGLSEEQWRFKSAPDRWSVGECAEHIVRSETQLFASAKRALETPEDPEWATKTQGKADLLRQVMPNRNPGGVGGASAPQEVRPVDGLSKAQVLEAFAKIRSEVTAFSKTVEEPLKAHIEVHPFPIFGPLSSYDWLLYVPLHTIRHSKQIVEVQESPGYPSAP